MTHKNGTTGTNGPDGTNGTDGKNGDPGKDGVTPKIGVKQDGGVWYWTVNGEWLLTDAGDKVAAESAAAIPTFKVEEGYWYVKVGNTEWSRIEGSNTGSPDIQVTKDDENVYITAGDTTIAIPLAGFALVAEKTDVSLKAGASVEVPYVLRGGDATTKFKVEATGGVAVAITKTDDKSGIIKLTAPANMPETAEVCITAVKNSSSEICCQYISVTLEITASLSTDKVVFSANEDLSAVVKLVCKGAWTAESDNEAFTVSPASGEGNADITITAAPNTGTASRSGIVSVIVGEDIFNIAVSQAKPAATYDFDGCLIAENDYLMASTKTGEFAKLKIENVDDDPYSFKLTATADNPWFFTTPLTKDALGAELCLQYKAEGGAKAGFRLYFCPGAAFNASYKGDFGTFADAEYTAWRWDLTSVFNNWKFGKAGDMMRIDLINMHAGDVLYLRYIHLREMKAGEGNGKFAL